ncbi:MAG: hypothetical protein HY235_27725 [Acidobacteria bacterium]|nr:hypothetical protein [Acidobacteriota bacterium]
MATVRVLGAGPAGSAAALAALQAGAGVEIFEKTRFPRHKVCGEFLSPESAVLLDRLGVWGAVEKLAPARLARMRLRLGCREKKGVFSEPAFGISRFSLDHLLLDQAQQLGARLHRTTGEACVGPTVVATGRRAAATPGDRLFGFKAHFRGPVNDAVELYFLSAHSYVGVSAVEGGFTNVCGLAGENALSELGFDLDEFAHRDPALKERLAPLERCWKWLVAGPLVFEQKFGNGAPRLQYPAGDALSFIDPFTGSGILSALLTGAMAGESAARAESRELYLMKTRKALSAPFLAARLFSRSLAGGWGQHVAGWLPASWLFRLTRPAV